MTGAWVVGHAADKSLPQQIDSLLVLSNQVLVVGLLDVLNVKPRELSAVVHQEHCAHDSVVAWSCVNGLEQ